jgi:hypothetical protein
LYLTWARQHIPEMQEVLNNAYFTLARKLGATVAPVGMAWQKALKANPALRLHKRDKSHPTLLGSYLAACVFYATLFQTSPIGLTGTMIDDNDKILNLRKNDARFLQSTAWETVRDFGNQ